MKAQTALLAAPIALAVTLAGCSASSTPIAAEPTAPVATPESKPTAAAPTGAQCYGDAGFSAEQENRGGSVSWPGPLTDDQIAVEPSCWVDALEQDRAIFLASWFGLDTADSAALNRGIEAALVDAGYHAASDSNGITVYEQDGAGAHAGLSFTISRAGGGFELEADPAQP